MGQEHITHVLYLIDWVDKMTLRVYVIIQMQTCGSIVYLKYLCNIKTNLKEIRWLPCYNVCPAKLITISVNSKTKICQFWNVHVDLFYKTKRIGIW